MWNSAFQLRLFSIYHLKYTLNSMKLNWKDLFTLTQEILFWSQHFPLFLEHLIFERLYSMRSWACFCLRNRNDLEQNPQLTGFKSLWILWYRAKSDIEVKTDLHRLHLNSFSPVLDRLCFCKSLDRENLLSQMLHWNGFSTLWVSLWTIADCQSDNHDDQMISNNETFLAFFTAIHFHFVIFRIETIYIEWPYYKNVKQKSNWILTVALIRNWRLEMYRTFDDYQVSMWNHTTI